MHDEIVTTVQELLKSNSNMDSHDQASDKGSTSQRSETQVFIDQMSKIFKKGGSSFAKRLADNLKNTSRSVYDLMGGKQ